MDINNDLTPSLAYWGSDNQYHSQATSTATESIISSTNIPLLIFSANIGQKPYTVLGTASGGSATPLTLTSQEILVDKYSGWNLGTSQYTVPSTGIYLVEFVSVMSNTANSGEPVLTGCWITDHLLALFRADLYSTECTLP